MLYFLKEEIQIALKKYMTNYARNLIRSRKDRIDEFAEKALRKYPFHIIFFPFNYIVISEVERSITAGVGLTFYTKIAEIIAQENYGYVKKNYTFTFEIDEGWVRRVDDILEELDRKRRAPNVYVEKER